MLHGSLVCGGNEYGRLMLHGTLSGAVKYKVDKCCMNQCSVRLMNWVDKCCMEHSSVRLMDMENN